MSEKFMVRRMWPTPNATDGMGGSRKPDGKRGWMLRDLSGQNAHLWVVPDPVSNQLTLFAEDFPVSPIASPASVEAAPTNGICGESSPELFAKLDRDGCWRKTYPDYCQPNLDGSLGEYSETWPRAGTMRNGIASRHQPLVLLTDAIGYGLLPTPTVQDAENNGGPSQYERNSLPLNAVVRLWSSPTVRHANTLAKVTRGRGSLAKGNEVIQPLPVQVGGTLNPTWVEWLMGYPLGWTVLEGWATRSSRRSRNGSGVESSLRNPPINP